jgi:hypothetical protein
MNAPAFAARIREPALTRDRRASLTALGAALAAVLTVPRPGKAKPSAAEKCKRRCRRQENACNAAVMARCVSQMCEDAFLPCCTFLRTCNTAAFVNCVFDIL